MKIYCGIYKIQNKINNKIYIGQSIDIERRFSQHKRHKDNCWIHQAIQKYGPENFDYTIIQECSPEQLDKKEKYWIQYYQSFGKNGYNQNKGGKNNSLYTAIENSKKRVFQFNLQGKKIAEFQSMREAERQTGILHIGEVCRHTRAQAGGFYWAYEGDTLIKNKIRKRKVAQINPQTLQIINIFNSIVEAAEHTQAHKTAIGQVCRGKRKTAGGFQWRYVNE